MATHEHCDLSTHKAFKYCDSFYDRQVNLDGIDEVDGVDGKGERFLSCSVSMNLVAFYKSARLSYNND